MYLTRRVTSALLLVAGSLLVLTLVKAQTPETQAKNVSCVSSAKQMALATLMYSQDYDEKLPPMKNAAQTQKLLFPYTKNNSIFTCPATQKVYMFNTKLSGIAMAKISSPATTLLLCDAQAHPDGMWTVAYVDGHCKREKSRPAVFAPSGGGKKPGTPHK